MASPSRDFLVQQATLTVLADRYPATIALHGRPRIAIRIAKLIESDFTEGREFIWHVGAEFGRLAGSYERAA